MNDPMTRPNRTLRVHPGWLFAGLAALLAAAPIVTAPAGATIVAATQSIDAAGLPRAVELASRIVELRVRIPLLERRVELLQTLVKAGKAQDSEAWEATAARDIAQRQLAIFTMAIAGERAACDATIATAKTGKTMFENGRMAGTDWMQMEAAERRAASALQIYDSIVE